MKSSISAIAVATRVGGEMLEQEEVPRDSRRLGADMVLSPELLELAVCSELLALVEVLEALDVAGVLPSSHCSVSLRPKSCAQKWLYTPSAVYA